MIGCLINRWFGMYKDKVPCVVSSVCCCCHLKYTKQNETKPTQEQCYLQTHVLIVFPSRHNTQVLKQAHAHMHAWHVDSS